MGEELCSKKEIRMNDLPGNSISDSSLVEDTAEYDE